MMDSCLTRVVPAMPSTDGIDYETVDAWSGATLSILLRNSKGRELFRVFLHENLADETLYFIEAIKRYKAFNKVDDKKKLIKYFFESLKPYLNISANSLTYIKEAAESDDPSISAFDQAVKEVMRMLENDQFPRFKQSDVYMRFLEQLINKSTVLSWKQGIHNLLQNQLGRYYFRNFLRKIRCEENLRFLEAASEFSLAGAGSRALFNLGKRIFKQFIALGSSNEIFLPSDVRNSIRKRLRKRDVDGNLFKEAIRHVERILKDDAYIRFLQSDDYRELLARLN